MTVLAIDPGPVNSGYVLYNGGTQTILDYGHEDNSYIRSRLIPQAWRDHGADAMYVERIASYGMAVGREVFDTCTEIGRFIEAWSGEGDEEPVLVERQKVNLHLCHSPKAKDSNIRQAVIDRLGKPGTKKEQGRTYGITSHAWLALALALYACDTHDTARDAA